MSLLCSFCLLSFTTVFSDTPAYAHEMEQNELQVIKVHDFENPEEGGFFTLSDGSQWLRTSWEQPVYFLDVGQTVTIIPMSDEEASHHKPASWFRHYRPYWLTIHPEPGEFRTAVVYIAFKKYG